MADTAGRLHNGVLYSAMDGMDVEEPVASDAGPAPSEQPFPQPEMLLPHPQSNRGLSVIAKPLFALGFGCIYTWIFMVLLDATPHIPQLWQRNPNSMIAASTVLKYVGIGSWASLLMLVALRPEMRRGNCGFGHNGLCKASRMAGYLWASAVVAGMISTPYLAWYCFFSRRMQPHEVAWLVAGIFTIFTVFFSLREVTKHLQNYNIPILQRSTVRVLLMAPVYAISCFLSMRLMREQVYFAAVRELYEAFVIFSFMHLMTDFLSQRAKAEQTTLIRMLASQPAPHHTFPVSCFKVQPWPMVGDDMTGNSAQSPFYNKCKVGVLQYVPTAGLCATLSALFELFGFYKEGIWTFSGAWLYLMVIRNLSQAVALYSLILFYHGTSQLLAPLRPLNKFLSIKLVIFFTFWQSVTLSILNHFDVLPYTELYAARYFGKNATSWNDDISTEEGFEEFTSTGFQDMLLCIEMFVAAIAHRWVFSYKDFKSSDSSCPNQGFLAAFTDALSIQDVQSETSSLVQEVADAGRNVASAVSDEVTELVERVGEGATSLLSRIPRESSPPTADEVENQSS